MLSQVYIATTIYNSFIQSLCVYLEIKARPSNCKKRMNDVRIFLKRENFNDIYCICTLFPLKRKNRHCRSYNKIFNSQQSFIIHLNQEAETYGPRGPSRERNLMPFSDHV